MKFGILIVVLIVSAQLFGQQTRMNAQAFQVYTQSMVTGQTGNTAAGEITVGNANSNTPSTASEIIYSNTSVAAMDNSCDVVVQEELIAGRVASGNGIFTDKLSCSFNMIKCWLMQFITKETRD